MSIKCITVKVLQVELTQDFDLLTKLAVVVLEKRYLIDQQEVIQLLVLLQMIHLLVLLQMIQLLVLLQMIQLLVLVQVPVVANHHHGKQEFSLHVQQYQDILHYYQL
jgi:hypothetical protein